MADLERLSLFLGYNGTVQTCEQVWISGPLPIPYEYVDGYYRLLIIFMIVDCMLPYKSSYLLYEYYRCRLAESLAWASGQSLRPCHYLPALIQCELRCFHMRARLFDYFTTTVLPPHTPASETISLIILLIILDIIKNSVITIRRKELQYKSAVPTLDEKTKLLD